MKALSIQQPWAWAILHAGKDVENRSWATNVRGRVLIHVGKKFDWDGVDFLTANRCIVGVSHEMMEVGGIVGSVEIVDCVEKSESPWFFGRYGFVLKNPIVMPFIPLRGQLGFFEVPDMHVVVTP